MINWTKIKNSKWFRCWVYKPYETKSYKSVSEMLSDRESHGFLYEIWFDVYCRVKHIWEWPGDRLRELKWYHQRGIRGLGASRIRPRLLGGEVWILYR